MILMPDETIVTETPPLYHCYGPIGEQVRVPIRGEHAKRVLQGAINVRSGDLSLRITEGWTQETPSPRSDRRKIPVFRGSESGIRSRSAHLIIDRQPFIESRPHFPLVSQALRGGLRRNYGSGPDGKSFDR